MNNINMVMISGSRGMRPSLFSSHMGDVFGTSLSGSFLGQGEDLYAQGKAAVAEYDRIYARLQRVGNQTVRNEIAAEFGIKDPNDRELAQYQRDALARDIARAESYTPINYRVFVGPGPEKNRPRHMDEFNANFREAVADAERLYGVLPEPQVITVGVPGEIPSWVLPAVVVAAGVGLLGAFGVIKF